MASARAAAPAVVANDFSFIVLQLLGVVEMGELFTCTQAASGVPLWTGRGNKFDTNTVLRSTHRGGFSDAPIRPGTSIVHWPFVCGFGGCAAGQGSNFS